MHIEHDPDVGPRVLSGIDSRNPSNNF